MPTITPAAPPTPTPTLIPSKPSEGVIFADGKLDDGAIALLKSYMNTCFDSLVTLRSEDITHLFADNAYEQAALNQAGNDFLVYRRKTSRTDLRLTYYSYELNCTKITTADDEITILASENNTQCFAMLKGTESKSEDIEHTFVIKKINGEYKIVSHTKEEDHISAVESLYTFTGSNNKAEIDSAMSNVLETLKERIDDINIQIDHAYNEYINDTPAYGSIEFDHAYDREAAARYAIEYALVRNDEWTAYDAYGGNCQNYSSQCVFNGGIPMDYDGYHMWKHYSSTVNAENEAKGRTPSWTGVNQFYSYVKNNKGYGMVALADCNLYSAEPGDIIQFGNADSWTHSVVVSQVVYDEDGRVIDIIICSNTTDRQNYPMSAYSTVGVRLIKIFGWNN
ncbi:MAG: hypothetical protein E7315_05530 [Clostridiales bacterium]|nr:hypothetical protein [Clostridiales bacterium]